MHCGIIILSVLWVELYTWRENFYGRVNLTMKIKRLLICLLCGVLTFLGVYTDGLKSIDKATEDFLFHQADNISGNIKIIKIDDKTMNQMGDFSTWQRDVYAELVEKLCVSEEIRPAVIAFDMLFSSEKDKATDDRFAQACAKYNNVVTGFSYVFTKKIVEDVKGNLIENKMAIEEKIMPYSALKKSTSLGFVNALMDEDDSIIRSSFLYYEEENGTRTQSFSSTVYAKYMEFLGEEATYPTEKSSMSFRYSGEPGDYENLSLIDVLDGTIPAEAFDGCIVLIGAYAPGLMDAYFVPVDRSRQMYGVEIHANVIQALLENKTLTDVPVLLDAILAAAVIILLVLFFEYLSVAETVVVSLIVIMLKFMLNYAMFRYGYSSSVLAVPIMTAVVAIYNVALQYYVARKAKQGIERAFSKYVAPQVVNEITKDGTYEIKLGGENRDIAVLFVDIRGFTTLSESLKPEQVVDILNGYLELTTESIFRHGGTLDKFVGDATMAVFNAPFDTKDYIYKAILAAWDIVQGGKRIEKDYMKKYGKQVGFGVGINCGPAVVGNIGCDFRMDYTAIGDTVNTAARLEANAPKGKVYISADVYERIKDRIAVEEVGKIPLKGKNNSVFVYSVTEVKGYKSPEEE